jgi:ferredoxin-like protein FixX
MTSTERGTAAWLEWQKAGMSPRMTKCVVCRRELRTDEPAPFYVSFDDGEFEIFFPMCLECGSGYRMRAASDSDIVEGVNNLRKVAG